MLAAIDITDMLTNKKLMAAFQMFDQDGGGSISVDEIIKVLGGKNDEKERQVWEEIIMTIDQDGNGEVSFDEFKFMML